VLNYISLISIFKKGPKKDHSGTTERTSKGIARVSKVCTEDCRLVR